MNTAAYIFAFAALIALSAAGETPFESCGGNVKSVSVDPCDTYPCEIPRGQSAYISVDCVSNAKAEKLKLSVFAELSGLEVPYPGMKRDACKGKNITCPISVGEEFTLVQKLEVKKFFPKIETKAKFLLVTDDDQDLTVCCFQTPVKVV